ncbi:DUF1963 domain-containing protein [Streptomyces phaeochromogenes]
MAEGREPLLLTVNCAALPPDVLDIELPADGHLLFFTDLEYPPESSMVLHVSAGAQTTEQAATYELDGETIPVRFYEPHTLYPVVGLTLENNWHCAAPETLTFLDGDGDPNVLGDFEDAVLDMAFGGTRPAVRVQIGGFCDPWDMVPWDIAPDAGDLVLFAQMHAQAIDYEEGPTLSLIVGTREDIAARRYANLQYEQQT